MAELKPCPFCGGKPKWKSHRMDFGTGASGMEAPQRSLGCVNSGCLIKPETTRRDTEEWEPGKGYHRVNYDEEAIAAWNRRAGGEK